MIRRLKRYRDTVVIYPLMKLHAFAALREKLREGYDGQDLKADLIAGVIVGLVAIPLGMALAIASGVAPQNGLYTVIIAGSVVAFLGGSRCQVSGPTAAFVVILAPIAARYGLSGLLVSGLLAGVLLILMGLARMGRLIEFIPYPVTTGFTSGIAIVIATLQLKDFFGLTVAHMPEAYPEKVLALVQAAPTFLPQELGIGALTLAILILWPRLTKRIPAPFVALAVAAVAATVVSRWFPGHPIATIGSRFSSLVDGVRVPGIPQQAPRWGLPWLMPGIHGAAAHPLTWAMVRELMPHAFAIAMLGAIESLLSAVVADGMARTRHDPDGELIALGIGNILCPFFGGIAATGAIARTATNIRFGARSPLAAVFHAGFALAAVVFLAPLLSYLPMAALAALLLLVAWNMSEVHHFGHILRVAPRSDVSVLLLCFSLTVLFDMVIGVSVGVVLAALLFMKRMSSVTQSTSLVGGTHTEIGETIPGEIMIYQIQGPLFFGAADRAIGNIENVSPTISTVIFDLEDVPVVDVTGLVAFESVVRRLQTEKKKVYVVGVQDQPLHVLRKAKLVDADGGAIRLKSLVEAVHAAKAALPTTS